MAIATANGIRIRVWIWIWTPTPRHFHAMQIEAFADNADRRQVLGKYDPLAHTNFII